MIVVTRHLLDVPGFKKELPPLVVLFSLQDNSGVGANLVVKKLAVFCHRTAFSVKVVKVILVLTNSFWEFFSLGQYTK